MRVYILKCDNGDHNTVESVFASYSAMLTWMRERDLSTQVESCSDEDSGYFKTEPYDLYSYEYESYNVIGMHSVKTEQIEFKE